MSERDEDLIGRLIRATGPRPAVSDGARRRVREQVRAHWQDQVARPARRRTRIRLALAAAAAVTIAAVLVVTWNRHQVDGDAGPLVLATGERLPFGADVVTGAEDRLVLLGPAGHSIRIDGNSRALFLSRDLLALDRGRLYVDSGGTAKQRLTVRTPQGDVREQGTQFEVLTQEDRLRVRVREGRVELDHERGPLAAGAGEELGIGRYGEVTRSSIRTDDPAWDWAVALAPMMEIEGRSAMEFLDWASRELGLELQFQDVDLLGEAAHAVLSGSIAGMTLQEALDAVLPTCGMTHTIENGTLLVQRLNT